MNRFIGLIATCLIVAAAFPVISAESARDIGDPGEMVLAVDDNGTRFSWELGYGRARKMVIDFVAENEPQKALEAAKAQFLLCPLDDLSISAAIDSVKEALAAADGNDTRAQAFEEFARLGPAGADGQGGTADDLENPIADVSVAVLERGGDFYTEFDRTIDARKVLGEDWQARWYETEKAFSRLDGGRFDEALGLLVKSLAEAVKFPAANTDENWQLQRNQDILDRILAGLGVVYRARTGTVAGASAFVKACLDYVRLGPAGEDKRMGTDDDLKAPI